MLNSFFEKYKSDNVLKKRVQVLVYTLISYIVILQLVLSSESVFQVPIDYHFYLAMVLFLTCLIILRGKNLKIIPTAAVALLGLVVMVIVLHAKNVSSATYGPVLFRVIVFSWLIIILSAVVLTDVIASGRIVTRLRNKEVWFFALTLILPVFFLPRSVLPVVLPLLAFLLIEVERNKVESFMQGFAFGYYLAFLHMIIKSFVYYRDRYEEGRFLGAFAQIETAGMFVGGAIVCIIYLIIRYFCSEDRHALKTVSLLVLLIPPCFTLRLIGSRSTMLAVAGMLVLAYVFLYGAKDKKKVWLRICVAFMFIVFSVAFLFFLSYYWKHQLDTGEVESLGYFKGHVTALTDPACRNGYFKDGSILNAFDRLCSGRLAIFADCTKQISWAGNNFEPIVVDYGVLGTDSVNTPHNFYLMWFINYGIIGGILMLVRYFVYIWRGVKAAGKNGAKAFLPVLWMFYTLTIFSFTCVTWKYPVAFILLFMQCVLSKGSIESDGQN